MSTTQVHTYQGKIDSFGRITIFDQEGVEPMDGPAGLHHELNEGDSITLRGYGGVEYLGTVVSVGSHIHTPGNGVSNYQRIEVRA